MTRYEKEKAERIAQKAEMQSAFQFYKTLSNRDLLSLRLILLPFSPRAFNLLRHKANVETLEDLIKLTRADLFHHCNCGLKTLDEIETLLFQLGLALNGVTARLEKVLSQYERLSISEKKAFLETVNKEIENVKN